MSVVPTFAFGEVGIPISPSATNIGTQRQSCRLIRDRFLVQIQAGPWGCMQEYHKLVRDRIPDIIRQRGQRPVTHVADDGEYQAVLREKVVEEAMELRAADGAHVAEECADVLEVCRTIANVHGISWSQIETIAATKVHERGGFRDRIILERVEE